TDRRRGRNGRRGVGGGRCRRRHRLRCVVDRPGADRRAHRDPDAGRGQPARGSSRQGVIVAYGFGGRHSPSDPVAAISGNWWAPFASGLLAIVLGVVAFAWPSRTFEALVLVFGVYAFVGGAISLSFGLLAASARERWWPLVVNGIVGISVGVLDFSEPQAMAVVLV